MESITVQSVITYLENNQDEFAEVILDNGTVYTTRYMKLVDDVVYVTTNHMDTSDVAVIPAQCINHIVLKNSGIEKFMGFTRANP